MGRTTNFTGDINQLWMMASNRMKVYRDIVVEAEKGNVPLATSEQLKQNAQNLTTVIQQLGTTLETSIGDLEYAMQQTYLAKADLDPSMASQFGLEWDDAQGQYLDTLTGTYYSTILTKIQADATSIVESYNYVETSTLQANINDLQTAILSNTNLINGQIRRGFIDVVENGITVRYFGIAITSREIFSTGTYTPEGETNTYYEIDTGECFGLYTATGWQFWRGNKKLGWFDTSDGQLHVDNITIESSLSMGDWRLSNNGNAFGIKYMG